jgi:sugar lactone lactonase YvrE
MKMIARSTTTFTVVALLCLMLLWVPGVSAQCTWGGTPSIDPPAATALRSYADPYGSPGRVATDVEGYVYATNAQAGKVLVWDPEGSLLFQHDVPGSPTAIAVSALGEVFVGEEHGGSVLIFDPDWNFQGQLGSGDGEFAIPTDISLDPASGNIYVADGFAHEVRVYYPNGAFHFSFGGFGSADSQFRFPSAVHVTAAGEVLVGDQSADKVKVFDLNGNFLRCFGTRYSSSFNRKFGRIAGLTSDELGRFYVADAFQGNVQVFDSAGVKLSTIGSFGDGPGQLRTPQGIAIDPFKRLFVGSVNTGRLVFFGLDEFSDPQPPPATTPDPPSGLVATAVSPYQIDLAWDDNSVDETGFLVYRDDGVSWVQIGLTPKNAETYSDSGLEPGSTQSYYVSAFNGAGHSAPSNEASATTLDVPPQLHPANVDFDPVQTKRDTKKSFITAIIEVPDADLATIETDTIMANGVPAADQDVIFGDADADGIPDIAVKFNAQELLAVLPDGPSSVSVTGAFADGSLFEGFGLIEVTPAKGQGG